MDIFYSVISTGSFFIAAALGGLAYVISSLAAVKVLRLFEYEKPAMGWVPFARDFALGTVCTQKTGKVRCIIGGFDLSNSLVQWGWLIVYGVYCIPGAGSLLGLVLSVFYYGTVFGFIYSRLCGEENTALAAVSGAVQVIFYVRMFTLRADDRAVIRSGAEDVYPKGDGSGMRR